MRPTLTRMWDALCAGRSANEVGIEIVRALIVGGILWACACAFMLMEPVS